MFGQILGAVAGPLIGGLFGNKGRGGPSPADNVNSLAKGAREAAEKYGFNPLTLLQAGAGAASLGGSAPALSSGAYISEAISRGVDTYFNVKQERADQEAEAIRAASQHMENVRYAQARDPLQRFGYNLTDVAPFGVPTNGSRNSSPALAINPSDPLRVATDLAGRHVASGPLSLTVGQNTPAEESEYQYGEIAGEVQGLANIATDLGSAAGRWFDRNVNPYIAKGYVAALPKLAKARNASNDFVADIYAGNGPKWPKFNMTPSGSNYFTTRHGGPLASFR